MLLQNDVHETTQYQPNSRMVTSNLFEIKDQGLREGMSRDVLIAADVWTSADKEIRSVMTRAELDSEFSQPTLAKFDLPGAIFDSSDFVGAKFKNIAYFTADCEVTLRVQGTPFQQGILAMGQIPYAKGTSRERRVYNEHLCSLTTFPHVKLNMAEPSRSVKLTVPFVNEFQNINPTERDGLSSVRVWVLSALAADVVDNEVASWAITARLTNIKLYGAAPTDTTKRCFKITDRDSRPWRHRGDTNNRGYPEIKRPTILECQDGEDEKASSQGIVSKVSGTIADVADVVSDIPIVSKIAKPIGWVARAVNKVASFFGFSKPTDLEKNLVLSNIPARGYTHVEGIDQSVSLSLLPDNAVNSTRAIASEQDEMSIACIAQTPYILERYDWNTTDQDKTIIMSIPVHPSPASTMSVDLNGQRTFFTAPIGLVTRLFHWWRGQLNIHFHFAKTQFHQGRLLIQYYPYGEGVQPLESVVSHILDLSQIGHEGFSIEFPSLLRNKWLSTMEDNPSSWNPASSAGVVVVSVLNKLIAAPTVRQAVTILPELSWTNFEVSEQTANCKIAIADVYDPPSVFEGSLCLVDESDILEFAVKYPCTISHVNGQMGNPVDISGSWVVVSGTSGFTQDIVKVSLNEVNGYLEKFEINLEPGSYTVKTSGLNVGANTIFFINRPVSVSRGTLVEDGVKTIYAGQKPEGEQTVLANWAVTMPVCSIDYALPNPTNTAFINDGSDVGIIAFNNTIPSGFTTLLYTMVPGPVLAYETGITNSKWLVLERGAPLLECQDFQAGDESNRETTMGEVVTSLRALTRRFTMSAKGSSFAIPLGNVAVRTPTTLRQSLFEIISWLYRFTSGSIRHKIICQSDKLIAVITANPSTLGNSPGVPTPLDITSASHIQSLSLNPIVEVTVPFYSPAENLAVDSSTFSLSTYYVGTLDGTAIDYTVLNAAGDDHTFSFRVGCPAFTV